MAPFGDCLIGVAPGFGSSGFIDALGLRVSSMLWVFGFHRCFGSSGFIGALVLRVSSVLWVYGFHRCFGSSGFIGALGLRVSSVLWVFGFHRCFGYSGFIGALGLRVSSMLWFFGRFSACLRVDRVLSVASEEACAAVYHGHSGFEVFSHGFGCG